MHAALLLLAFLGQFASRPPDVPLADPAPDFPLHVHIIAARWGQDSIHLYRSLQGEMRGGPGYYAPSGSYHGFGSGNLLGDSPRGFDYSFDCHVAFVENRQPQDFYQARWIKQDQRLEILMQPIGTDHGDTCELKVALKQHPFDLYSAREAWNNLPLSSTAFWEDPEVAFTVPDPDYPVHLHVITGSRRYYNNGAQGYGTANIMGDVLQGADYSYDCAHSFLFNTQPDEFFQGRWVKQNQRMDILLQRIGTARVDRCEINISLKSAPYSEAPASAASPSSSATPPAFSRP